MLFVNQTKKYETAAFRNTINFLKCLDTSPIFGWRENDNINNAIVMASGTGIITLLRPLNHLGIIIIIALNYMNGTSTTVRLVKKQHVCVIRIGMCSFDL